MVRSDPKSDPTRECNECEWVGLESETVHPKHWPQDKLCPECHAGTMLVLESDDGA